MNIFLQIRLFHFHSLLTPFKNFNISRTLQTPSMSHLWKWHCMYSCESKSGYWWPVGIGCWLMILAAKLWVCCDCTSYSWRLLTYPKISWEHQFPISQARFMRPDRTSVWARGRVGYWRLLDQFRKIWQKETDIEANTGHGLPAANPWLTDVNEAKIHQLHHKVYISDIFGHWFARQHVDKWDQVSLRDHGARPHLVLAFFWGGTYGTWGKERRLDWHKIPREWTLAGSVWFTKGKVKRHW